MKPLCTDISNLRFWTKIAHLDSYNPNWMSMWTSFNHTTVVWPVNTVACVGVVWRFDSGQTATNAAFYLLLGGYCCCCWFWLPGPCDCEWPVGPVGLGGPAPDGGPEPGGCWPIPLGWPGGGPWLWPGPDLPWGGWWWGPGPPGGPWDIWPPPKPLCTPLWALGGPAASIDTCTHSITYIQTDRHGHIQGYTDRDIHTALTLTQPSTCISTQ